MVMKVNLSNESHHNLKVYCANRDLSMTPFVQEAVKEKMEREPLVQQ